MALSTPVQERTAIDQWFQSQIDALKLSVPLPELPTVQQVLEKNLPQRIQRLSRHISDPSDPTQWLHIIFKASHLIKIHPTPDRSLTLAINCSANLQLAQEQLELVRSAGFSSARKDLGIDRHIFLVVPGFPLQLPKASELLDGLYRIVEGEEECAVLELG